MKTLALLALLAASIYYYHPFKPASTVSDTAAEPAPNHVVAKEIIVAPAPSYKDRWKTGPSAYTDLKTGPNAQVTFEPFLPDAQATWNQNQACGYTSASGVQIRGR
jgi:hypothetical protein